MAKEFVFKDPGQLKEIEAFAKEGSVMSVARVWSAAKRQSEKTAWDGKIGVEFETKGRERAANVFRNGIDGKRTVIAKLKYTPALQWCAKQENIVG